MANPTHKEFRHLMSKRSALAWGQPNVIVAAWNESAGVLLSPEIRIIAEVRSLSHVIVWAILRTLACRTFRVYKIGNACGGKERDLHPVGLFCQWWTIGVLWEFCWRADRFIRKRRGMAQMEFKQRSYSIWTLSRGATSWTSVCME